MLQGESGLAVLSTKTRILFCSLELQPGETRQFFIREKIPANAPPSYRYFQRESEGFLYL